MLLRRGLKKEITKQLSSAACESIAQWIGCFGVVWNLKVAENKEAFADFRMNGGSRPKPDQKVAPLIDETRLWLREVPSQVRRNAASEWMKGMQAFFKGRRGVPRFKSCHGKRTCLVTKELFTAELVPEGLHISLRKTENSEPFSHFVVQTDKASSLPNQLWLSRVGGRFFVSFSYEFEKELKSPHQIIEEVRELPAAEQGDSVTGCDLGVCEPVVLSDNQIYKLSDSQLKTVELKEKRRKQYQRSLARKQRAAKAQGTKTGKNYQKTKAKLSQVSASISNSQHNFCHHTSKACANTSAKIIVCEDLKIKNMTSRLKAKQDPTTGKWLNNGARAKAGLNRAILSTRWGIFLNQLAYKLRERDKLLIRTKPHYSSQECYECGYTDKGNRITRNRFHCLSCAHTNHADINAAQVLKKRFLSDLNAGTFVLPTKTVRKITLRKNTTARNAGLVCGADIRPEGLPLGCGVEAETSTAQA